LRLFNPIFAGMRGMRNMPGGPSFVSHQLRGGLTFYRLIAHSTLQIWE
jgi:hypothetical protein